MKYGGQCQRAAHHVKRFFSWSNNHSVISESDSDTEADAEGGGFVEVHVLRDDLNAIKGFPTNAVRTARYTLWTALPLSLLLQFYKVSNLYFLLVMAITLIPGASPINPLSSVIPLVIVLGAGIIKDQWDDWKRRACDKQANETPVNVLKGENIVSVRSADIRPGDVLLFRLGEEVRADCLVLNTSLPDGLTYIETANLDGETNAKVRRAKTQTVELMPTVEDIIEMALPDTHLRKSYCSTGTCRTGPQGNNRFQACDCCKSANTVLPRPAVVAESQTSARANDGIPSAALPCPTARAEGCPPNRHGDLGGSLQDGGDTLREMRDVPQLRQHTMFHDGEGGANIQHFRSHTQGTYYGRSLCNSTMGIHHVRHLTLDERLLDEGVIPIPSGIRQLSRQYEAAHSVSLDGTSRLVNITSSMDGHRVASSNVSTHGRGDKERHGGESKNDPDRLSTVVEPPSGVVVVGSLPCPDISSWFGQLRLPSGELVPLGVDQFLPRGCMIRNTEWVLAVALYTGKNTKMLLNLRPKPRKKTVMSHRINQVNIILVIFAQVVIFILCGLGVWMKRQLLKTTTGSKSGHSAWYIQWDLEQHSDLRLFWWRYLTNFVLLSYLIPISLYVTLEFNQAMQMLLMASDRRMAVYDAYTGGMRKTRPKTSELNCQLAHVEYIFTDKTGTLTENLMTYVGGYVAGMTHNEKEHPGGLGRLFLQFVYQQAKHTQPPLPYGMGSHTFPCMQDELPLASPLPKKHTLLPGYIHQSHEYRDDGVMQLGGTAPRRRRTLPPEPDRGHPRARDKNHDDHSQSFSDVTWRGRSGFVSPSLSATFPAQSTSFPPVFDEAACEGNDIFCYLRALSLCHSVVCFDAVASEEDSGEDEAASEKMDGDVPAQRPPKSRKPQNTLPDVASNGGLVLSDVDVAASVRGNEHSLPCVLNCSGSNIMDQPSLQTHTGARPAQGLHGYTTSCSLTAKSMRSRRGAAIPHLCGRTGQASWHANRYSEHVVHQRTATLLSAGGPPLEVPLVSSLCENKIYEGQSLDEIALVRAARENAFGLYKRTAKQMSVVVLGKMMCYDIIAEMEFTPQRKLMSILLQRNPSCDSEATADVMMKDNGRLPHYRRGEANALEALSFPVSVNATRGLLMTPCEGEFTAGPWETDLQSSPQPLRLPAGLEDAKPPFWMTQEFNSSARTPDVLHDIHTSEHAAPPQTSDGGPNTQPYLLLVKGADSSMMEIMNAGNPRNTAVRSTMVEQLDAMANRGLRTLVLGQRNLSEKEVKDWLPIFHEAQCSMHERSERLHAAYALIERDIDLLGTTAVEDELQDGVPETLAFLLQVPIVVWMLTGDKRETAVTIAKTSGLASDEFGDSILHLDVSELLAELAVLRASNQQASRQERDGKRVDQASGPAGVASGTSRKEPACAETVHNDGSHDASKEEQLQLEMSRRIEQQMLETEHACDEMWERYNSKTVVLVVDGKTLDFIFEDDVRAKRFFTIGRRCRSAVCCRMTPLQKAQIVSMFQKNMKAVALAIGDGANDVSMIQESKIGIGIMGLEGSQAELASDYAIPKFRFLRRLLMVHGRFSQYRESHCILFSIYKNTILTMGLMLYPFFSAFSGQTLIDSWLLAMMSIFFCALQPLLLGIFDRDVEDELAEALPTLYPPLAREHMYFSAPYIAKWLIDGAVEGILFFFAIMFLTAGKDDMHPFRNSAIEDYGTTFFTMLVLVADLRVASLVSNYTIIFAVVIPLEIAVLPVFQLIYSEFHSLAGSNRMVYTSKELFGSGKFYMFLLLAVGVFVVYTMASNLYIQMFIPWRNAGLAMAAARASPYRSFYKKEEQGLRLEYEELKKELYNNGCQPPGIKTQRRPEVGGGALDPAEDVRKRNGAALQSAK